jgi:hypothetical protein
MSNGSGSSHWFLAKTAIPAGMEGTTDYSSSLSSGWRKPELLLARFAKRIRKLEQCLSSVFPLGEAWGVASAAVTGTAPSVRGSPRGHGWRNGKPKHLGARIGITAVLHTWGSALTHHPHVHMIVPGGITPDGRWVSSRPAFLLPVRVLGALFRRLFLLRLIALHDASRLAFFGTMAHLAERQAFLHHLSPVRKKRWVVYAKAPFPRPCLPIWRATPTASPSRTCVRRTRRDIDHAV